MSYDVIIVGGGLAGCAAAIQLARSGWSVLLVEKKTYPAHKLCGEFLSPEVTATFHALGVLDRVMAAKPHRIGHARLTAADGAAFEAPLPAPALGLSRYVLDQLLLQAAADAGAEVHDGTTVSDVEGNLLDGFRVDAQGETFEARVVLGAFGKRSRLDRALERPFVRQNHPYVAFKAHYEGLDLGDVVELHAFAKGYCGLSHVEEGRINACWIGRVDALQQAGGDPEQMIEQVLYTNPALRARMEVMERVTDRFEAVSQVCFDRKGTFEGDVCMIGDTAAMIAPLCGDGMAMALQAAGMAAPLVDRVLDGTLTARAFRDTYQRAWEREFGLRLRLGRAIQTGYERPLLASAGIRLCRMMPRLGQWLIQQTRG